MQIKANINVNNLSKSYNEIKEIKSVKEGIDNNKLELPLSNRLNLSDKFRETKEKEKNKESSSKKGALKILELLTSKKKEKEELEKKKEELMIETFKKARNENDIVETKDKENNNDINDNIIKNKDKIEENDNNIKEEENNNNKNMNKNEDINVDLNLEKNDLINKENMEFNSRNKIKEEKNNINEKKESNDKENKNLNKNEDDNEESLSLDKSSPKLILDKKNLNQDIQINKNKRSELYIKNPRKFVKNQINPSKTRNSQNNTFSISKEKPNVLKQKRNKVPDNALIRHKSFKNSSNTIEYQNKNKKNINRKNKIKNEFDADRLSKDNFDTITIYKKRPLSKSPKGKLYAPKKAINPRGSSMNKNNKNSLMSKSNININNVNYINNINTIIKNRNDNNYNDEYNGENLIKLNNSLNINMSNNYNNFVNNYKCIDNYNKYNKNNNFNYNIIRNYNSNFLINNQNIKKKLIDSKANIIRQKIVNNDEEAEYSRENINNKYNKKSFQIKANKNFLLNRNTPDKNLFQKNNSFKYNLNSNPQRNIKNPKVIESIYNNKYIQNNNLSQRNYIYNNNNSSKDINNIESTSKYNSQNFNDLNNEIITTEGIYTNTNTNSKFDNFIYDNDIYTNLNKNSSISINIEDLMVFEEKFSEIIYFLKNGKEVKNLCFDFWNYFFNCSLFGRFEKIFKTEKNIEAAKYSINLELITVMICYEFSFDYYILNKSNILLLEILELSHRNLILIYENILFKILPENQKNIWVLKLNNLVQNSKKNKKKNFSNLSHIELININSSELSKKLQHIFSSFETEYSPLIYSLYKKIHQKTYSEINDFFIEYIFKIENKESSILAPVLLSSNPNFISFRPPYIHTERIKSYTLILDLNDTIVNFQQTNNSQGILRLRPFLIEFLEEVSFYYELIIFTTSTEYFSKPIINAIEEYKKYFDFIFYREYAIIVGNDFVKDLTRIGRPLDSTVIVDNMPQNFRLQKENGIHIKPFYAQDPNDSTLIELMNILIDIAKSGVDVREGLAIYRNDIVQKVTSNISKYNI